MKSNIVCTTVCTSTACEFCSHWQYLHTFLPYTMYMALVRNPKSLQQIDLAASDYNSNSAAGCGRAPQRIHSTTTCSSVYQLLIASKISAVVPKSSIYHASNQRTSLYILCVLRLSAPLTVQQYQLGGRWPWVVRGGRVVCALIANSGAWLMPSYDPLAMLYEHGYNLVLHNATRSIISIRIWIITSR